MKNLFVLFISIVVALSLVFSSSAMTYNNVKDNNICNSFSVPVDDPALYLDSEKEIIEFFQNAESRKKYPGLSAFYDRGFYPIPYSKDGSFAIDSEKIYEKDIFEGGCGYATIDFREPHDYPFSRLGFSIWPIETKENDTLETVLQRDYKRFFLQVQNIEVYNGREIAYWQRDQQKGTFTSCLFIYGKYMIVIEALGTLKNEPWSNEYFDLFDFKHIELPGNVSTESNLFSGDVNRDGRINTTDALYTLQHTVGKMASLPVTDQNTCLSYKEPSSNYKKVGDTCRDGYVNVTDALYIIQYAVGKIDDFPYGL